MTFKFNFVHEEDESFGGYSMNTEHFYLVWSILLFYWTQLVIQPDDTAEVTSKRLQSPYQQLLCNKF